MTTPLPHLGGDGLVWAGLGCVGEEPDEGLEDLALSKARCSSPVVLAAPNPRCDVASNQVRVELLEPTSYTVLGTSDRV